MTTPTTNLLEWIEQNCFDVETQDGLKLLAIDYDELRTRILQEVENVPTTEKPSVLPKFLYLNQMGYVTIGYNGDTVVEDEWNEYIATQQSKIERLKAELEEVSIWIQINGWQFSTVFASKDSAWINPKTNEVKSFIELYTIYQSQKQKT
tara:strand:- start:1673 stop:2122 length:450 start_codon:yes stop_codon:yes gene_type:complete